MFSQRIRHVMDRDNLLTSSPQCTVSEAARLMAGNRYGAVLVVEHDRLVGIFTEHDAVLKVLAVGLEPGQTRLGDVMTKAPRTAEPDGTFGHALQVMHHHGLRLLPVVEQGRPVGIVCARDALDPEMEEFTSEALRREGYEAEPAAPELPAPKG
jgi:CBS domain-containing protein